MAAQEIICDTDVMIEYFDGKKERHRQTTDLKLYTYNQKDFKFIKGIKLYKPA